MMSVRNFILECCCTYTSLLSQIISPSFFNLGGISLYFLNYDYDIVKEGTYFLQKLKIWFNNFFKEVQNCRFSFYFFQTLLRDSSLLQ